MSWVAVDPLPHQSKAKKGKNRTGKGAESESQSLTGEGAENESQSAAGSQTKPAENSKQAKASSAVKPAPVKPAAANPSCPLHLFNFSEPKRRGPNIDLGTDKDLHSWPPIRLFLLLIHNRSLGSATLVTDLCAGTNEYAAANNAKNWTPLTPVEACRFMGVLLAMGLCIKPDIKSYWSESGLAATPEIAKAMPRDRFLTILRYLHFPEPEHDGPEPETADERRLRKISVMCDHLNRAFMAAYNLGNEISADEIMVKFTGRLAFLQYVPLKPVKWGLKLWALADPHSGYLYAFKVYAGQDSVTDDFAAGLGGGAILALAEKSSVLGKGHTIIADNFFMSPAFAYRLLEHGTHAVGTCRTQRSGFPEDLVQISTSPTPPRGTTRAAYLDVPMRDGSVRRISAFGWQDSKAVYMLSTRHNAKETSSVPRWDREQGARVEVEAPTAVDYYNKYMIGVDNADQLRGVASRHMGTCKWWKSVFFFGLKQSVTNAYVLHRELAEYLEECRAAAKQAESEATRRANGGASVVDSDLGQESDGGSVSSGSSSDSASKRIGSSASGSGKRKKQRRRRDKPFKMHHVTFIHELAVSLIHMTTDVLERGAAPPLPTFAPPQSAPSAPGTQAKDRATSKYKSRYTPLTGEERQRARILPGGRNGVERIQNYAFLRQLKDRHIHDPVPDPYITDEKGVVCWICPRMTLNPEGQKLQAFYGVQIGKSNGRTNTACGVCDAMICDRCWDVFHRLPLGQV